MAATIVELAELPAKFAEIASLLSAGQEVIVTERHVPRAKLVPLTALPARIPGLNRGSIEITPDFDEPLPDEFWAGDA